jgi:hypothetical protein
MKEHASFLPPQIEPFASHCLLQKFHHFKILLFLDSLAIRQIFMVNDTSQLKKS